MIPTSVYEIVFQHSSWIEYYPHEISMMSNPNSVFLLISQT